jgi:hypothetical protein
MSYDKNYHHDITEILLKVALNTITSPTHKKIISNKNPVYILCYKVCTNNLPFE